MQAFHISKTNDNSFCYHEFISNLSHINRSDEVEELYGEDSIESLAEIFGLPLRHLIHSFHEHKNDEKQIFDNAVTSDGGGDYSFSMHSRM